jgi:predicted DCC family thiol-disulfide oxidoreductase YuxK
LPVAKNPKSFLIYDANCHFCINIAHFLKDFVVIENLTIVPNTSKKCLSLHKNITRQVIQKDVHLVIFESKTSTIYSGSDAVSKVMSLKENFGFIWKINKFFPLPFKILYFLSKKFKKYTY